MKDYGRIRSTVKPKSIVIDEFSVWINKNITEINENVGEENEFIGYEYDMVQYTKDEYIQTLVEENNNTQLALAELTMYISTINGGA